jgi:hypothetical protein
MGVMAVVLRPALRCRGKGEKEHRQDRGDPDVEGRLHIGSLPERVHAKALAIAMLACRLHGLVPRGAEGLCFRAGKAAPNRSLCRANTSRPPQYLSPQSLNFMQAIMRARFAACSLWIAQTKQQFFDKKRSDPSGFARIAFWTTARMAQARQITRKPRYELPIPVRYTNQPPYDGGVCSDRSMLRKVAEGTNRCPLHKRRFLPHRPR